MITNKSYNIVFYSNGLYINDLYVTNMHTAIGQAIYSINHTNILIIDQVKIYKVGKLVAELVAELNKWKWGEKRMKLNDLLTNDLLTILKDCDIVKVNPISDENGNIIKIIVEYIPCN